jgi:hypothetical protein
MTTEEEKLMLAPFRSEKEKQELIDTMADVWRDGFRAALDCAVFNLRAEEMHDAANKIELLRCK